MKSWVYTQTHRHRHAAEGLATKRWHPQQFGRAEQISNKQDERKNNRMDCITNKWSNQCVSRTHIHTRTHTADSWIPPRCSLVCSQMERVHMHPHTSAVKYQFGRPRVLRASEDGLLYKLYCGSSGAMMSSRAPSSFPAETQCVTTRGCRNNSKHTTAPEAHSTACVCLCVCVFVHHFVQNGRDSRSDVLVSSPVYRYWTHYL